MKPLHFIVHAVLSSVLAASGFALAQGTGGGAMPAPGSGVYPAPTQGVEQDPAITDSPQTPAHQTHAKKQGEQPMNDPTRTPGANASSGTKAQ